MTEQHRMTVEALIWRLAPGDPLEEALRAMLDEIDRIGAGIDALRDSKTREGRLERLGQRIVLYRGGHKHDRVYDGMLQEYLELISGGCRDEEP